MCCSSRVHGRREQDAFTAAPPATESTVSHHRRRRAAFAKSTAHPSPPAFPPPSGPSTLTLTPELTPTTIFLRCSWCENVCAPIMSGRNRILLPQDKSHRCWKDMTLSSFTCWEFKVPRWKRLPAMLKHRVCGTWLNQGLFHVLL